MAPAKTNTSNAILVERRAREEKMPVSCFYKIPPHLLCSNRHLGQTLRTVSVLIVIACLVFLSSTAFGANPSEYLTNMGHTGGNHPKGHSWVSRQQSVEHFRY